MKLTQENTAMNSVLFDHLPSDIQLNASIAYMRIKSKVKPEYDGWLLSQSPYKDLEVVRAIAIQHGLLNNNPPLQNHDLTNTVLNPHQDKPENLPLNNPPNHHQDKPKNPSSNPPLNHHQDKPENPPQEYSVPPKLESPDDEIIANTSDDAKEIGTNKELVVISFEEVVEGCYTAEHHQEEIIFNCENNLKYLQYVEDGDEVKLIIPNIGLAFLLNRSIRTPSQLKPLDEILQKAQLIPQNKLTHSLFNGGFLLFGGPSAETPIPSDNKLDYLMVDNESKLKEAIALLSSAKSIAIDTETTGLDPYTSKLRLIQLATSEQTFIIDCFKVALEPLAKLFDNPDIVVIGHNLSFDLKFLQKAGIKTQCKLFDTMIAYKLLNSGLGKEASLKNVLQDILGIEIDKSEQTSNWSSEELSPTQLDYAATDVVKLPQLYDKLKKQLIDNKLVSVAKLEFDCILAVVEMELSGFLLEAAKWEQHKIVAIDMLQEISDRLRVLLGNINFNSAQQIKTALSSAGIKVQKTDYETLAPLAAQYPEIATLLEYKKISSLINKFLKGYLEKLNPVTGRLHSSFNQMGAETGRFSSNNPNLQQIPRDKDIRSCFIAPPGNKLVIADYSQIELRIAAEISQDSQMIKAFNNGDDLHKLTASLVLGKPLEEVSKSDRQIAKSLNFGLLYGMGAEGLQKYAQTSYGVSLSLEDAKSYRDKFFKAYQGLAKWHEATKKKLFVHKVTRSETLGGRKRDNIKGITDMLNTPVQGTGADILKVALGELARILPDGVKIIACVHDEIILECAEGIVDEVGAILKEVMIKAGEKYIKAVPVEVDVSVGGDWGEKG